MQCCVTVQATFRKQQTPQLWMEGVREGCGFLCSLKLPYLSTTYVSTILSLIEALQLWWGQKWATREHKSEWQSRTCGCVTSRKSPESLSESLVWLACSAEVWVQISHHTQHKSAATEPLLNNTNNWLKIIQWRQACKLLSFNIVSKMLKSHLKISQHFQQH